MPEVCTALPVFGDSAWGCGWMLITHPRPPRGRAAVGCLVFARPKLRRETASALGKSDEPTGQGLGRGARAAPGSRVERA